jgi:hypothetical protein
MRVMFSRLALASFLAALLSTAAVPAQPKVLLCGAGGGATTDLRTKLLASGAFAAVDEVDCNATTPSLAILSAYDAVEVSSNSSFHNRGVLGGNLADYVDNGGGVVLMMFTMFENFDLLGRWSTGGYSCVATGNYAVSTTTLKPTPNEPSNPLVQGVTGITTSYRSLGGLNASQGAVSVWEFNDGVPAVCRMSIAGHRRVDLNFSPIPTWTTDTVAGDAALLAKNALLYVSGGLAPRPSPLKLASPAVGTTVTGWLDLVNRDALPSSNIDGAAITRNGAEFSVEGPASFPFSIAGSSKVPFRVHFTPAQTGVRSGELTLTISDPNSPTIRIPLQGTCGPPAITLSSNTIVFPTTNVGSQSSAQQVDVSNSGFTDLVVNGVVLTAGSGDFSLDATNLANPLAPGASSSFRVRFTPFTGGLLTGSVTVSSNDPAAPTKVVNLSGTGRIADAGADATDDVSNDGGAVADGPAMDVTESDAGPADAPGIADTRTDDEPDASLADAAIDQSGSIDSAGPDASSQDASAQDGSAPAGPDGSPVDGTVRDARDAAADLSVDSLAGSDRATSDVPRMDLATPPNDALGADGSRDGAAGSGGKFDAATDGNNGTTPNESDDRGCGCRAGGGTSTRAPMWSMLVLLAAMLRKRVPRFRGRS